MVRSPQEQDRHALGKDLSRVTWSVVHYHTLGFRWPHHFVAIYTLRGVDDLLIWSRIIVSILFYKSCLFVFLLLNLWLTESSISTALPLYGEFAISCLKVTYERSFSIPLAADISWHRVYFLGHCQHINLCAGIDTLVIVRGFLGLLVLKESLARICQVDIS